MKVLITGASSGIGAALARYYADQGATLGLVARRKDLLDSMAESLPTTVVTFVADVRDAKSMQGVANEFIRLYGAPDIVIANAGVSGGTLVTESEDLAVMQVIFDINVMGIANTFHPFMQEMQSRKRGTLVGIASVAGIRGLPGASAYSASKAAAIAYLESLRVELASQNLHVVTIAPGYIRTPMTDVNQYPMPFLMDVDLAAAKFAQAIANKKRFVVIPWPMAVVARLMRFIPPVIWDWMMKNAPHKSRQRWDWL